MDLEQYMLDVDDMGRMRSWEDVSYAMHPNMKSHTGGVMSFGTGGIIPVDFATTTHTPATHNDYRYTVTLYSVLLLYR